MIDVNKSIPLWVMTFDNNPELTYIYADKAKLNAAVGSHVQEVCSDFNGEVIKSKEFDELFKSLLEDVHKIKFSSIIINKQLLTIRKLCLDKYNPIHSLLVAAYDRLGDDDEAIKLKEKINNLFI